MSLSVFSNRKDLIESKESAEVTRLSRGDLNLLPFTPYAVTFETQERPSLEVHVYTPTGEYLTGAHDATYFVTQNSNDDPNPEIRVAQPYQNVSIDTGTILESLGIKRGTYKVLYNLFSNLLGSYQEQKLFIKEISPTRTELRLQLVDDNSPVLIDQYTKFQERWESQEANDIFDSYVLNTGFNRTYQIINMRFDIVNGLRQIVVKLYLPLDKEILEKDQLWISEEVITPFIDTYTILAKAEEPVYNILSGPNFDLEEYAEGSVATEFQSWNDLLGSNIQTSQQLIDSYFSGSLSGMDLNINYRLFDNFVHYSSATERVKNFYYKLQLIESYTDRIEYIATVNGGNITQNNLADLFRKRNNIVSSFDNFEKYLFFESTGSILYTHYDTSTGSIDPWPKTEPVQLQWQQAFVQWSAAAAEWTNVNINNIFDPYDYFAIQARTDSAEGRSYYVDLLEKAEIYDKFNVHRLQNTVPIHIQEMLGGEEYVLFVNMIAQHFDILWTYINEILSIHTREEHPKDGMPNGLLYHVASSMGFELLNGKSASELWRYALAVDENGQALQSEVENVTTLTDESNTKEIWRRIVNNLPYILKTKGTARSIKALLTCFGIPTTVLRIREFGGPSTFTDNDHYPEYIHDVFHYAWYANTETGSLQLPITQYTSSIGNTVTANTLELRFKTDNNFNYGTGIYYNILSISSASIDDVYNLVLTKDTNTDNEGTLILFNRITGNAISASNLEIFDNSWHTVAIEANNSTSSLYVAKSLYGNPIYFKTDFTYNDLSIFPDLTSEQIVFSSGSRSITSTLLPNGDTVNSLAKFNGHYQEVRIWSGSLNQATLEEHAASPNTYTFNVDRTLLTTGEEAAKPYDHLLQRFTLSNKKIYSGSFYQESGHPNQQVNVDFIGKIYFTGYDVSSSITFEGFEEAYYTPSPSLGGQSLYSQKIRIESASLDPNKRLNTKTRIERSSYDRYSLDSNRLGIYFSPQTAINEDIFNQLGYFEIDDYIGDPSDINEDHYTALNNFAIQYWKKYENKNDFEAYFRALEIYDFTVFKYIKRLVPLRANLIAGLVVEPNVLERSRVKIKNRPTIENLGLSTSLLVRTDVTASGEYQNIEADIETPESIVTSTFVAQHAGLIETPVIEFEGTVSNIDTGLIDPNIGDAILESEWVQHRYIGGYRITESGSYDPIQTTVYNSRTSGYLVTPEYYYSTFDSASLRLPNSSSLVPAQINNDHGAGYTNLKWNGSKINGPAVNVNSTETTDGGPVVKVTQVNPNRIVFSSNQLTTLNQSITGQRATVVAPAVTPSTNVNVE